MKQTALFALFVALAMTATTSAQVTYTCTAGTDFNEYEGIAKLFDGDTDTKFCGNAGDNVYALVTASEPVFVWGYEMTTANDNEDYGRLLTQWVLYGTNDPDVATDPDASGWVTLSDPGENGIVQMRNFYTQRFFCEKEVNKPFKYFKLVLKKGGFVQLSEFKILGETHRVIAYKWKESSDNNSQKATDLLVTQKWEGCNLAGNWVTLEADDNQPHAVKGYSFTTSDDGSWNDRAPKSWKIEGSNDYTTWTLIDEVTDDGVIQNMNFKTFDFTPVNTSGEYRYIRLTLTAMRGTGWTQVGEFHVLSTSGVSDAVYYTNLVNKAKAAKTDYEALLGADDAWCQEYAVFFAGLDLDAALATAKSTGDYAALEDKLTAAENHAIAQALKPLLSGGSYIPINGSACWGDGHYSQLLDGKESTKWGGNFPGEGDHVQYVIFRAKQAFKPFFYKLVTGNDTENNTGRNWKTWSVYGADFASFSEAANATYDSEAWTLLDERVDVNETYLPMKNLYPATFDFNKGVGKNYLYYMVKVVDVRDGTQQQMSEMYLCTEEEYETVRNQFVDALATFAAALDVLEVESSLEPEKAAFTNLYDELQTTTNAVRLTEVYNLLVALKERLEDSAVFAAGGFRVLGGNTAFANNENHTKLLDGDIKTKWGGLIPDDGAYVIFKTYAPNTYRAYQLTTADDTGKNPFRNWKDWKIYGANFDSDDAAGRNAAGWTLIDEREDIGRNQLPAESYAPACFNFNKTVGAYKYYKIEVSAAYDYSSIQMAEFKMFADAFDSNDLSEAQIDGVSPCYQYTGNDINVSYTVYDFLGNPLTAGTDYTAALTLNGNTVTTVNAMGVYTLTVTSKGSYYTNSRSTSFEVNYTVNDDNNYANDKVPVDGSHVNEIALSQFILPASSLTAMANSLITTMTFYAQEETVSWGNAQFEVYMTEVDNTTFADATPASWITMSKVKYSGSLSVSDGKMEVRLNDPYRYSGGNLLICFLAGNIGDSKAVNWYGVSADNASLGGYGTGFERRDFLPKVSFHSEPTYALAGTNVLFFEQFVNDYGYEQTRGITRAVAGQTVTVSMDADNIPDDKYLTGTFSSDEVASFSSAGYAEDATFVMPAKAVTVNAGLADRTECEIDLTSAATQVIPFDVYLTLMQQEGYYNFVYDPANDEYLSCMDLNLDGTPDLRLMDAYDAATDVSTYSVAKLAGATSVTVNSRFTVRTFPGINHSPYSSVLVKLNDSYNEETMPVIDTFQDDIDNSAMIAEWAGDNSRHIMIYGRTLWKNDKWNTLCLPFSMTAAQVTDQLAPTKLMELDTDDGQTRLDAATGTLYLYFKDATAIEAGKPYIVKWDGDGTSNLVNPLFSNVTIPKAYATAAEPTPVTFTGGRFTGTYGPTTYTTENTSILFLGTNNTLYYPQPDLTDPSAPVYPTIGAFRAYFEMTNPSRPAKSFVLNFSDGNDETGISTTNSTDSAGAWYDLSGRRIVNTSRLTRGIYIHNGRKVLIR